MVSNVSVHNFNKSSPAFSAEQQNLKLSAADKFIRDVNKTVEAQETGGFASKYMWSPTAGLVWIPVLGYEIYSLAKLKNLIKMEDPRRIKFSNKIKKTLPLIISAGIAAYAGLEYLFSRNSDKKYEQFKQNFENINIQTKAKLRDKQIRSSYMGAMCSPVCEEITINKNLILDPISRRKLKKLVKHELVHAKQYETIACSQNGIKKLNCAVLMSSAKNINNPAGIKEIENIYQDINNDKTGKYDNVTLRITGADVDLKKYIEGIHTILTDKDVKYDDLPIVIDEKHYQQIRKEKGDLTEQEEEKAEQYFSALINYPQLTFWNMMNPFSSYYDNLLEREAYKENPNFITFVRHLFIKD